MGRECVADAVGGRVCLVHGCVDAAIATAHADVQSPFQNGRERSDQPLQHSTKAMYTGPTQSPCSLLYTCPAVVGRASGTVRVRIGRSQTCTVEIGMEELLEADDDCEFEGCVDGIYGCSFVGGGDEWEGFWVAGGGFGTLLRRVEDEEDGDFC